MSTERRHDPHRRTATARRRSRLDAAAVLVVLLAVMVAVAVAGARVVNGENSASGWMLLWAGPTPSVSVSPEAATAASADQAAGASQTTGPSQAAGAGQDAAAPSPVPQTQNRPALPAELPAGARSVQVPIVMYHYVNDVPPPAGPYADALTVRTKDFEAQMEYLADNGYSTLTLEDVYLAMAGLSELPAKAIALTFDDGGLDNYTVAFPILLRHEFLATFFVITGTVGREGQMSWEQLQEMVDAGMSVESHTVSHPDLRHVPASRLLAELTESRESIQAELGRKSLVLCYPAGAYDARVIQAARDAGYLMAVATDKGREGDPAAIYELKRRRVSAFLPLSDFVRLVH